MKAYVASQKWMPPVSSVPSRVQKALLPFTPTLKGWNIWYQGKTRTVCGITTPLEEVSARWEKRKAEIDAEAARGKPLPGVRTLREAISDYFVWLDYRVTTGKPKPLAQVSADDYKRNLVAFAKFEVSGRKLADLPLADFGPEQFQPYAESLATRAPSSVARIVATITGFFNYCRDEGRMVALPNYGRYFARPPQALIRDRRLQQKKSFEPEEIWALVEYANAQERAWIGLALCGAMDNSDIGHLTFSLFDREHMVLDYRRRKQGLPPSATGCGRCADLLAQNLDAVAIASTLDSLRGQEGDAARLYFEHFALMTPDAPESLRFSGRTRRPPLDPVNSLLSFFYSILAHDCTAGLVAAGLDPSVGFFHEDRPGRPSLALDLMEEFRAPLVDRFVITLINRRQVSPEDFETRPGGAVFMTDAARKRVITAFQQRKMERRIHPHLQQESPLGRFPVLQAKILARHVRGDLLHYVPAVFK